MGLITENPWPLIVPCLIAAVGLFVVWNQQRRKGLLIGAVAAITLALTAFVVDHFVVTTAEQLEQNIRDLTAAFQRTDRDRTLSFFSAREVLLKMSKDAALENVKNLNLLQKKDVQVTLLAGETLAKTRFRANGTVSYQQTNAGHQPSRWELKWQREGADWKIIEVHRLHPMKDEELQMFSGN
ncbi:MAG: hypothetical protein HZA46_22065 [Planctomycetales bacterium]|nr:hypothetical protein [Planctomycetales bacterium]